MTMIPKLKVVPKSELSIAEINTFESKIEAALLKMAVAKQLADSLENLIVRDCLPEFDLDFTTSHAAAPMAWVNQIAQAAAAWTDDIDVTLTGVQENRVFAFYKVFNRTANPGIMATRFSLGEQAVLGVLHLEELWAEEVQVGYFGPIFYTTGERIRIEHYADAVVAQYAEQIGFPAMVCEALGREISQNPKTRIEAAKWT